MTPTSRHVVARELVPNSQHARALPNMGSGQEVDLVMLGNLASIVRIWAPVGINAT